jgi:hypothetical protein
MAFSNKFHRHILISSRVIALYVYRWVDRYCEEMLYNMFKNATQNKHLNVKYDKIKYVIIYKKQSVPHIYETLLL